MGFSGCNTTVTIRPYSANAFATRKICEGKCRLYEVKIVLCRHRLKYRAEMMTDYELIEKSVEKN